jgi:DNA-binding GntR family transcriptional regulator
MTEESEGVAAATILSHTRLDPRSLLADEIYDVLRASLISEEIAPGTKLNLDELARELHVSNTPVRQALARLESDGLVVKEAYRGFFAAPPIDLGSIEEVYDLRLLLEPAAASRAARQRAAVTAETLHSLIGLAEQEAAGLPTDRNLDGEFHLAIAEATGSALLHETVMTTLTRMSRYPLQKVPDASASAWSEHRDIAAAIAVGDAEAAKHAMQVHLTKSFTRYREIKAVLAEIAEANAPGVTISQLGSEWLTNQSHLKPSSLTPVEIAWRLHVEPQWGHRQVGDIRQADVQHWISTFSQGDSKPRSATTVLRAHAVLASILDLAVKNRRIPSNPARGVNLPRKR